MPKVENYSPTSCENCGTTDEGCTDNYHPELGWCCEDCREEQEWEDNHGPDRINDY